MANTNCLTGVACAGCGQEDRFQIATTCWAEVVDNGVEAGTEYAWDETSRIVCPSCGRDGKVADFMVPS